MSELTQHWLQSLIANGVKECKGIEYKSELPGGSDSARKEFLADVSSFANASGGILLFGVVAKDGIPTAISGLDNVKTDHEVLRLAEMIQTGIEPRIPGLESEVISTQHGPVMAIRVPRSWIAPHMIVFKGSQRFFARNAAGKYALDVGEIRRLSILSEAAAERLRRFRIERVMAIEAGETPITLQQQPAFILHLVPLAWGLGEARVQVDLRTDQWGLLQTMAGGFSDSRYNFDGCLTFALDSTGMPNSYVQVFRDGRIEAVDTDTLSGGQAIPSVAFERRILETTGFLLKFLDRQSVSRPIGIMLTAIRIRGFRMSFSRYPYSRPIDRDRLIVPEVISEDPADEPAKLLRPCFDAIWNAASLPRSQNYDSSGAWRPE